MGPTNTALVNLYHAERELRDAQELLDAATKNVRLQHRRVTDATEKLKALRQKIKETQAKVGQFDLEIKTRDAHIDKLRTQQQAARNNKEYQAFLVEINTGKVDKAKLEEESLKLMELLEKDQAAAKELTTTVASEQEKLTTQQAEIGEKTQSLQAEVDRLTPIRDQAASKLPPKARDAFARLADRYDGEAMSPLVRPDRRLEEYLCTACHMELVRDVYNRLHSRDDLVVCTSCGRILYIPENLTPDVAVNKPKEKKELKRKAPPAAVGRQTSASDVLKSIQVEDDEPVAKPAESSTSSEPAAQEATAETLAPDASDAPAESSPEPQSSQT
jgi:predicted  nucleic acid-binding Zn-ribbon protein